MTTISIMRLDSNLTTALYKSFTYLLTYLLTYLISNNTKLYGMRYGFQTLYFCKHYSTQLLTMAMSTML